MDKTATVIAIFITLATFSQRLVQRLELFNKTVFYLALRVLLHYDGLQIENINIKLVNRMELKRKERERETYQFALELLVGDETDTDAADG